MKKLALMAASAATAMLMAAPAFAAGATVSTNVQINGTVTGQCGVGNQSGGGTRTSPATVNLPTMVDGDGFLAIPDSIIGFDNLWCNTANTLTMTVTPLSTTTPNPDFRSFVNYLDMVVGSDANAQVLPAYFNVSSPNTVASTTSGTVETAGASGASTTITYAYPGAFETGTDKYSRATLHIRLPLGTAGNNRPVAGSYTGTVTITATPTA